MFLCPCGPKLRKNNNCLRFNPLETPKERIIKMALLGPSDSGKTTIIKQFKKISGYNDDADIQNMASFIKENMVMNMKRVCAQALLQEQNHSNDRALLPPSIQQLCREMLLFTESELLTEDIAFKIRKLWTDDALKATLQQRNCFQIDENISYFFDKIEEIGSVDYVPDFEDYVRIRRISIGYSMTKFVKHLNNLGDYFFEVLDIGGARSERKKWWNNNLLLDMELNAIVYTVPIADYDLTLFEDNKTNRLIEAISLFKDTMVKSDFFNDTPLFLLFTKYDVFVDKIKRIPIQCFDDFPVETMNPNDADEVIHFIAGKFTEVLNNCDVEFKGPLTIHKTCAIDTESIEKVFNEMMPRILRRNVGKYENIH